MAAHIFAEYQALGANVAPPPIIAEYNEVQDRLIAGNRVYLLIHDKSRIMLARNRYKSKWFKNGRVWRTYPGFEDPDGSGRIVYTTGIPSMLRGGHEVPPALYLKHSLIGGKVEFGENELLKPGYRQFYDETGIDLETRPGVHHAIHFQRGKANLEHHFGVAIICMTPENLDKLIHDVNRNLQEANKIAAGMPTVITKAKTYWKQQSPNIEVKQNSLDTSELKTPEEIATLLENMTLHNEDFKAHSIRQDVLYLVKTLMPNLTAINYEEGAELPEGYIRVVSTAGAATSATSAATSAAVAVDPADK